MQNSLNFVWTLWYLFDKNWIMFEIVINKKQKAGKILQFCIAQWISMPVLCFKSSSLFQIKHCHSEIKNWYWLNNALLFTIQNTEQLIQRITKCFKSQLTHSRSFIHSDNTLSLPPCALFEGMNSLSCFNLYIIFQQRSTLCGMKH